MEQEFLKAKILSAQRNDKVIVECPHCELNVSCDIQDLKGEYTGECPHCSKEFEVNFDTMLDGFIPVFEIK